MSKTPIMDRVAWADVELSRWTLHPIARGPQIAGLPVGQGFPADQNRGRYLFNGPAAATGGWLVYRSLLVADRVWEWVEQGRFWTIEDVEAWIAPRVRVYECCRCHTRRILERNDDGSAPVPPGWGCPDWNATEPDFQCGPCWSRGALSKVVTAAREVVTCVACKRPLYDGTALWLDWENYIGFCSELACAQEYKRRTRTRAEHLVATAPDLPPRVVREAFWPEVETGVEMIDGSARQALFGSGCRWISAPPDACPSPCEDMDQYEGWLEEVCPSEAPPGWASDSH